VVLLTWVEMAFDALTIVGASRWWASGDDEDAHLPMRAGAASTVLHAARVGVFVLGRTGPWVDFDVRPEHRAGHRQRWTWAQVIVAGALSVGGLVGLIVIGAVRRRRRCDPTTIRRGGPTVDQTPVGEGGG
jgi:hypothetical protein